MGGRAATIIRVVIAAAAVALSSCTCAPDNSCPAPQTGTAPTGSYLLLPGEKAATTTNLAVSVDATANTLKVSYSEGGHQYVKTYRMILQQ